MQRPTPRIATPAGFSSGLCHCEVHQRSTPSGPVTVLRIVGELDRDSTATIGAALADALAWRPAHLLIDLTELEFCSGRGMALLVETGWAAAAVGIGYCLTGATASLERTLTLRWAEQVPRRYRDTTEAIAQTITHPQNNLPRRRHQRQCCSCTGAPPTPARVPRDRAPHQ